MTSTMGTKYWKLKESNRVIAVSSEVVMSSRWEEISKEEFEYARALDNWLEPLSNHDRAYMTKI